MQQELVYHKCQVLHGLGHSSQQCARVAAKPYHDLGWIGEVLAMGLREVDFFPLFRTYETTSGALCQV